MIENDSSSNYLICVIEWIIHPVKLGLLQAIQQNFVFPPNAWNLWHLSSDQFERKIIISSEFSKECWVLTCSIDDNDKLRLPQTVFHLARSLFIDNSFNNSIRITSDNWRASLIYCCIWTYYLKSLHIRCVCWCCCSRYTDLRNIIDDQMSDVLLDCIRFLQNIHVVISVLWLFWSLPRKILRFGIHVQFILFAKNCDELRFLAVILFIQLLLSILAGTRSSYSMNNKYNALVDISSCGIVSNTS